MRKKEKTYPSKSTNFISLGDPIQSIKSVNQVPGEQYYAALMSLPILYLGKKEENVLQVFVAKYIFARKYYNSIQTHYIQHANENLGNLFGTEVESLNR